VVLFTVGLSVLAFRFGEPPFVLILPILAWAAFRLGDLGVVLAGTAVAAVANYMTAAGYGAFAHLGLSPPASLAVTQAYIAIVVLLGWVLAQEVTGRMSAVQDRDQARVQHAMAVVVMVLALLAQGFRRSGEFELPVLLALLMFGGGLVFVRALERWL